MEPLTHTLEKTEAYLEGEDIFFEQFNDVDFYVEDQDQEELYEEIFNKLLPNIKIHKVFSKGGKRQVIDAAKQQRASKRKKIFIVDKDYDDLLGNIFPLPNLFYLNHYCIENYFLEECPIVKFIVSEKPRNKKLQAKRKLKFNSFVISKIKESNYLHILFFIVQKNKLDLPNTSLPADYFLGSKSRHKLNIATITKYEENVRNALLLKSQTLNLDNEINSSKKHFRLTINKKYVHNNISGKFLLKLLYLKIRDDFSIQCSGESMSYKIAQHSKFDSLNYLINDIKKYLKAS